jgi:outer membrane biogenesis lipoprotein LolB
MKNRRIIIALLAALLSVSGCASLIPRPEKNISPEAGDLLERIVAFNSRLKACKGIGTISFRSRADMPRMRFAWLCRLPDRIRLELLGATGTPLLTLSADGDNFYFLPRADNSRLRKEKAAGVTLGKAIAVPLPIPDAAHLLAGRIPLLDFDTAERIKPDNGKYGLLLRQHRPERTETIIFDETTDRPCRIEFRQGSKDALEYAASFSGVRTVEDTTIPESIILENGQGESVAIEISRFWPETDLPIEKFVLTNP